MDFPSPLIEGRLVRRYARFLADVEVDGCVLTVHVPNSGRMTGLDRPGSTVFLSRAANPKRKLSLTLELVLAEDGRGPTLVGINTGRPNGIVAEAIAAGRIPDLAGYGLLRREVPYGEGCRADIVLEAPDRPRALVEVKNVHLVRTPGLAEFPDCPTVRGTKHLHALAEVARGGERAVMVWLVHRGDCERLSFAADLDPAYARAVAVAAAAGVDMLAYGAQVTASGTMLAGRIALVPGPVAQNTVPVLRRARD